MAEYFGEPYRTEASGINEVAEDVAREALRLASHKLPVKCKIARKGDLVSPDKNEEVKA